MNHLIRATCVAALTLLPAACNTSSQGGNPGTRDSFTVTAPTTATNIKQGDRQTVKLSLDRGTDFRKTVNLTADAPKGLKADLGSKSVAAAEPAEVTLTLEADNDAALGDHIVKVTATPENGVATTVDVKVTVEQKQ